MFVALWLKKLPPLSSNWRRFLGSKRLIALKRSFRWWVWHLTPLTSCFAWWLSHWVQLNHQFTSRGSLGKSSFCVCFWQLTLCFEVSFWLFCIQLDHLSKYKRHFYLWWHLVGIISFCLSIWWYRNSIQTYHVQMTFLLHLQSIRLLGQISRYLKDLKISQPFWLRFKRCSGQIGL